MGGLGFGERWGSRFRVRGSPKASNAGPLTKEPYHARKGLVKCRFLAQPFQGRVGREGGSEGTREQRHRTNTKQAKQRERVGQARDYREGRGAREGERGRRKKGKAREGGQAVVLKSR